MSRESGDEIRDGRVYNGFDYALQVWVLNGIIQPCGHPSRRRLAEPTCCNQNKYALFTISEVKRAPQR